jgi:hypothetical protein
LPERQINGSSYTNYYWNTAFNRTVLYCALDNLKDLQIFFAGINTMAKAGIPPSHVRGHMRIDSDKNETWDRIWYRFKLIVERDIEPYPMVFHQRVGVIIDVGVHKS